MSIIYSETLSSDFSLAIARNTESISSFEAALRHPVLSKQIESLHERRKIEIVSSHKIIGDLMERTGVLQFLKDDYNKPQLINSDLQMSISHSSDLVAGIISKFDVGIDIQKEVAKIHRIKNKFLSDEELAFIDESLSIEMMHVMWGAKESMYKAYGKKKVNFKTELIINPFKYNAGGTRLTGTVHKNDYNERFDIYSRKIGDFHLVFAVCISD